MTPVKKIRNHNTEIIHQFSSRCVPEGQRKVVGPHYVYGSWYGQEIGCYIQEAAPIDREYPWGGVPNTLLCQHGLQVVQHSSKK